MPRKISCGERGADGVDGLSAEKQIKLCKVTAMKRRDNERLRAATRVKTALGFGMALATLIFSGTGARAAETAKGYLFQPPYNGKNGLSRGCDLDMEKNVTSLSAAYFPEEQEFCFRTTDQAIDIQTGQKTVKTTLGENMQNYWLVVNRGAIPNGAIEYAIIYVDIAGNRLTVYPYCEGGAGGAESYRWPGCPQVPFVTVKNAIVTKKAANGRAVSFCLKTDQINKALPGKEWKGIQFDEKIGIWYHTALCAKMEYADGTTTGGCSAKAATPTQDAANTVGDAFKTGAFATNTTTDAGTGSGGTETEKKVEVISPGIPIKKYGPASSDQGASGGTMNGGYYDTGDPMTAKPFGVTVNIKDEFDSEDIFDGVTDDSGGSGDDGGPTKKKRFAWCTLSDDLTNNEKLGASNIGMVSVKGPEYGFMDVDTLRVECLSSFSLFIDTSTNVEGISFSMADGFNKDMKIVAQDAAAQGADEDLVKDETKNTDDTTKKPLAKKKGALAVDAKKTDETKKTDTTKTEADTENDAPVTTTSTKTDRFYRENAERRFELKNTDGKGGQIFKYGTTKFKLTFKMKDGTKVTEDHQLTIPRMEWGN
ncbi:MAG: hypothetical protein ABW189_08560 [Rickettsiales bacterium]